MCLLRALGINYQPHDNNDINNEPKKIIPWIHHTHTHYCQNDYDFYWQKVQFCLNFGKKILN